MNHLNRKRHYKQKWGWVKIFMRRWFLIFREPRKQISETSSRRKLFLRWVIIFIFYSAVTLPVFAVTISTNIPGGPPSNSPNACATVFSFYNFALMIGGILAFCAIVY